MEENNTKPLMSEEEFSQKLAERRAKFQEEVNKGTLFLRNYYCVNKFKSVRRAIKRGNMSVFGDIYPRRPFNNRKTKDSELKRKIYGQLKATKVA